MQILIFSDLHLYNKFDEKKYKLLKKLISKADRVIINGDFWDGYICTFAEFINSPWKKLFPFLKEKKTVYIYGNHDREMYADKRVSLFSDIQADKYILKTNGTTFHIEHGHRLHLAFKGADKILFNKKQTPKTVRILFRHYKKLERTALRIFGKKLLKVLHEWENKKIKIHLKDKIFDHQMYVFGHTHFAEIDLESRFINTGIIQHGLAQYLFIDDSGFKPQEEWY